MDEDLAELLHAYEKVLYDKYHCLSEWVFPAREADRCLSNGTIDKKVREFWTFMGYLRGRSYYAGGRSND